MAKQTTPTQPPVKTLQGGPTHFVPYFVVLVMVISIFGITCAVNKETNRNYSRFRRDSLQYKTLLDNGKLSTWEYLSLLKGSKQLNRIK